MERDILLSMRMQFGSHLSAGEESYPLEVMSMMSVKEAASRLGIGERHIQRLLT